MDWTSIEQVIKNPLFIVVAVILVLLLIIFSVFAFKSVGKGEIKKLSLAIPGVKLGIENLGKSVTKLQEDAPKVQESISKTAEKFKKEVDVLLARSEYFEHAIFFVLDLIPNEKVKQAVKELKSHWKEETRKVKEYVGISVTEIEEQLRLRDLQIAALSDEIVNLKELLKETVKEPENGEIAQEVEEYGEREEGTND